MMLSSILNSAARFLREKKLGRRCLAALGALTFCASTVLALPVQATGGDVYVFAPGTTESPSSDGAQDNQPKTIANGGADDLTQYLTDVTLQKSDGHGGWVDWEPEDGLVLGDNYKMKAHFAAGAGSFQQEMHWDLGDSVSCAPVERGRVKNDAGEEVGTYSIDKDGRVTVTFDEEFLKGSDQTLDMEFYLVPTKDPDLGNDEFPWSGKIDDKTDIKNTAVLDVEKKADHISSDNDKVIVYEVTATVTEGMVKDGKLEDSMTSAGLTLNKIRSIKIYDAYGNDVSDQYADAIAAMEEQAKQNIGKNKWTMDLPTLTQGMRMELEYESIVADSSFSKDYEAVNTVTFSGKQPNDEKADPDSSTAKKHVAKDQITKSGNVVEKDGKQVIEWSVRLGSGQFDPLGGGSLDVVDTLGKGLSFNGTAYTVEWKSASGEVKGTHNDNFTIDSSNNKKATYTLRKDMFSHYSWQEGDYLEVTYYTDFNENEQPEKGFENTVSNQTLAPDGVMGRLPVGEAIQKNYVDYPEAGYLEYTVKVDVAPANQMATMGGNDPDERGHAGQHYFYIKDELRLGDNYYPYNEPQNLTLTVVGKNSKANYDFKNVPYTSGLGDQVNGPEYSYQVVQRADDSDGTAFKDRRSFCIYFNVAKYGVGEDGKLEHHDSIWDINEPTEIYITYQIPYDTPLVDKEGNFVDATLGEILSRGVQLTNTAGSRRSGVTKDSTVTVQKTPEEGEINKAARYVGDGVVEYSVTFENTTADHTDKLIRTSTFESMKPTLYDTFDGRMEYVPGTLRVDVYRLNNEDELLATYAYKTDARPVDPPDSNKLVAALKDFTEQTYNDGEHFVGEEIKETFSTGRRYVFVYQLRLKDKNRKTWESAKDVVNTAMFRYGEHEPTDDAKITIPSDMLQKSYTVLENGDIQYTLHVNNMAVDLVTKTDAEGFVNLDSYKLVDEMSQNLQLATKNGEYVITVERRTQTDPETWEPLDRASSGDSVNKDSGTYYRSFDKNGNLFFILPDETALRITYTVTPEGVANANTVASNKATLYADETESDERKTIVEVEGSGASASSKPPIRLTKVETGGNKLLPGAEFTLYSNVEPESITEDTITVEINGEKVTMYAVGTYVTNDLGEITQITAPTGEEYKTALYALKETEAPAGYVLVDEPYFFRFPTYKGTQGEQVMYGEGEAAKLYSVKYPDVNDNVVVENPPAGVPELPETGGPGTLGITLLGWALLAAAVPLLRRRKA